MNDQLGRPVARDVAPTNYLGVMGRLPVDSAAYGVTGTSAAEIDSYVGVFRFNKDTKMGSLSDGTSNTLLFGEVTGVYARTDPTNLALIPTIRTGSFGWNHSGLVTHFNTKSFAGVTYPTFKTWTRFSSQHTGLIQWTLGDGSVKSISTSTDPNVTLSLTGIQDGQVFDGSVTQ